MDGVRIAAATPRQKDKGLKRIKGEPRTKNELARKLRAMAARITDREMLEAFLRAVPAADRERVAALVVPHVRFI
jgi:hypothetical protein